MADPDQLIYENSNTYRLHADNLRWTLLGGYVAILAAILSLSDTGISSFDITDPSVSFILFFISFAYLWILAIQNWFYNLFARFVDECEYRLSRGEHLRPLQAFAEDVGARVNPFHPAFFLAELIVSSTAYYFLFLSLRHLYIPKVSEFLNSLPSITPKFLAIVFLLVYFGTLNALFRNWNIIYKWIIKPLSNLYQPNIIIRIHDES